MTLMDDLAELARGKIGEPLFNADGTPMMTAVTGQHMKRLRSRADAETAIGVITAYAHYADSRGRATYRMQPRLSWRLNDKPIAGAKLAAMLAA